MAHLRGHRSLRLLRQENQSGNTRCGPASHLAFGDRPFSWYRVWFPCCFFVLAFLAAGPPFNLVLGGSCGWCSRMGCLPNRPWGGGWSGRMSRVDPHIVPGWVCFFGFRFRVVFGGRVVVVGFLQTRGRRVGWVGCRRIGGELPLGPRRADGARELDRDGLQSYSDPASRPDPETVGLVAAR